MNRIGFGCSLAAAAVLALSAPASAGTKPSASSAETQASWEFGCAYLLVSSDKDISNLVYRVDGVDTKIEFTDGTTAFVLPGATTDVWIKSGSLRSGDGPGYGMHHQRPQDCDTAKEIVFTWDSIWL